MMMQHKTLTGSPIATAHEGFYDRMQRIAARNLMAASRTVTEKIPDSAKWFCIQVDKGKEFSVQKRLSDANVEVYLPTEKQVHTRRGKRLLIDAALFPGYLMARCLRSDPAFSGIKRQREVIDIVGDKYGRYHVIRDEIINAFMKMDDEPTPRVATDKTIGHGDRADIVTGPFSGFVCTIVSVKWCRQAKANVIIDLPGRSFEIDSMPLAFLKKL